MGQGQQLKNSLGLNNLTTIFIDCDDVVFDLLPAWVDVLNKYANKNLTIWDIDTWDISKIYKISIEEALSFLQNKEFWDSVKIKPDAIKYLPMLSNSSFDLYFVTATDLVNANWKFIKLAETFSFVTQDNFIVCNNKQLLGDKNCLMIDDNPLNLFGGKYKKILYTSPHNVSMTCSSDIERVHNWYDILQIISNYSIKN